MYCNGPDEVSEYPPENDEPAANHLAQALDQAGIPSRLLEQALNQHAIVSITDTAGNITYANPRFCQTSGYSQAELLGKNHRIVKSEAHDAEFFRHLWQTISSGQTWQGMIQNRRKDGSPYWVQSTIVPIPGNDGLPQGYISIRTDVTERILAKQEYQNFQHILDQTLDCVFIFDAASLRFLYVNQGAARQVGYRRAELLGMTPFDINPQWDRKAFESLLRPLREGLQEKLIFEARQLHRSGRQIPVEIFLQLIRDTRNGDRFIAIVRDISERQRVNRALEKMSLADPQQDIFFQLCEAVAEALGVARVGISHVGEDNIARVLGYYHNGQPGPLFEYPLPGTPCNDVCGEEISLTVEHSVTQRYPEARLLADIDAVSYRGEPLATADNQVVGVLWAIDDKPRADNPTERALLQVAARRAALELQRKHDLGQLRQANRELDELVRALRALSEVNQHIVHAKDEQQLLNDICRILVEETGYRMAWVGYKRNDASKRVEVVAHAGHQTGYLDHIEISWDAHSPHGQGPTGSAIRENRVVICHDMFNDPRFAPWRERARAQGYTSSIALPLAHDGEILGALNLYAAEPHAFPEKEVKLLSEMANDLAFGIAHLRAAKEKARLERQLRQSQKMEALGHLTAGIAHDFNNILASIMGYTELALQQAGDDARLQRYLGEVYSAGERARDIIAQMLSFGRDQASNPSHSISIDPVPVMQETLSMLRASLPSTLELKLELPASGKLSVPMDPGALQQVLMNLVINARDATNNKGEVVIRLLPPVTEPLAAECASCGGNFSGRYAELQVIDQGHGLSKDTLKHIFEPFFTTKAVDKGTGMGLAVIHGVVHKAGGHILVDSRPGEGSAFRILLPLATDQDEQTAQPGGEYPHEETLHQKRALIVDDEAGILGFLQEWLESQNMQVTAFQDSSNALEHFSQHADAYDLLISDQTMPLLTGMELCKAVRKLRPDLPIIVMSGYNDVIDRQVAEELSVAFIEKPFTPDTLLHQIARAFGNKE